MTTTQPTAEQLRMARECAVSAVSAKLPGLMGNDFKGNIPKLRARIAKMRCAEGDHFVEVQSALLAIQATEARAQGLVEALEAAIATLAASRHLLAKYAPEHHWLPEHDQRIADAKATLATWRRT